jgi:cytochrome oxidase assembly protein ShyY1
MSLASPVVLLLQRRWMAGHLLALFMAALFVALGFWQLARNTEKHDKVAREKAAYAQPAPEITAVAASAADGTRAQATGTFDGDHETVLRNQVFDGNVGIGILTPLRLPDGTAVLVDRGFVRAASSSGVTTDPPPTGTAVVHGLVHASSPFSANDTVDHLDDGALAVPRVDLAAIGRTLPYKLQPRWIEAQAISPAPAGNAPALPQPPPPDPVNHMQYAIQWFAFALIPIIGWPIALRRLTRQRKAATNVTTESTDSSTPMPSRNGRVGSRPNSP